MIERADADWAWEQAAALLAVDSPSGYTAKAAEWVKDAFQALGYPAKLTEKGGVLADLAPTMLDMMGLPQPAEMTGHSLLVK